MKKQDVQELFNQCMEQATADELKVIHQLLTGVQRKKQKYNDSYISAILNMEKFPSDNEYKISIPINTLTDNSLGIVHGGITATVLDTVMGTLANTLVPEGYGAVTSNLAIHFIAPGKGEKMETIAKIIHKGTNTLVIEGTAFCDNGKKIAHCTGTFFIIKK
ncbi:PaaI family thioesterase [Heyndrickxia camelliae]|uniref:PaaI family thioesterase n=1 Tax=Heyndrickxia camelliae TaxID=1707093 RepID=A0A2N3LQS8_9BACI|nr:PaaI family thioesterase [Heyndrickxia camelliae]PKR86935.1 PaaI family thioesterase [Heyndrickxia camelliae]